MIQITPQMRILLHSTPVDFRKGIDGLCGICKYELSEDPFSGALFIFCNRSKSSIKILTYDGQGFWVYQKRLSRGKFQWWPSGSLSIEIASKDLSVLIWNGNPGSSQMQSDWKSITSY
jgi:transposase